METTDFGALGAVSDQQLRAGLAGLLASGARTEARIVAHLAEVLARKLYLRDGSASAFDYCQTRLALSASEAFHRLTAANIARKFPVVFAMLERREVHLSGVCLLRDYLTPANHRELLAEASYKTKLQILELLARRFPRPDVTSRIRKLPPLASRNIRVDPCLRDALTTADALTTPGQQCELGELASSAVRDEPMPASARAFSAFRHRMPSAFICRSTCPHRSRFCVVQFLPLRRSELTSNPSPKRAIGFSSTPV